ncbi:induced myeloid leukemia cell differentiation protein Mcl-1a [Brachyhypopomus gauderio]|uniref:induced myeloid leukemia cell differentiation protein Mcl-1a n=1 Tax=Brachyhypopomus gauderio TaxID=698409 RepID=UPI004042D6BF
MSITTMKRTTAIGLLCNGAQNGVDNNFFLGLTENPTAMAPFKKTTEDELDGTADDADGWPVKPGKNGKGLVFDTHFPQSSNEDGSLPTSPDSQESLSDFSSCFSELDRETRELIGDFYRIYTGLPQRSRTKHNAMSTLRRVVGDVICKHRIAYNGMVQKLKLEGQGEDLEVVTSVAKSMFSDGMTNWGRVASLLAFGAVVCEQLKQSGRERCVDTVAQHIASYLTSYQHEWLLNNKSWDGFTEFFRVEDPESVVRNALMAVAGFAGLGAGLALLIR